MAPPPIARRNAPARRAHHTAAPFADARRFEPLRAAVLLPFQHRQLGLAAADQPGIEQLAGLGLARLGAVIIEDDRSEEHTSELQSLMRISYHVFFLKKKNI